jgi:putative FmdB family regulatory protein
MPTYEYACRACGHRFDVVQSMTDAPLTTCPRCQGELRKVFTPPSIAFKGSGFYATDHGKRRPPDKDAKPEGEKKDQKKKDQKKEGASKQGAGKAEGGSTKSETSSTGGSGSEKGSTST